MNSSLAEMFKFCLEVIILITIMKDANGDDEAGSSKPGFDPQSCGETSLTDSDGWVTSPGYPDKYKSNTFCEWIIEAKEDHVIEIEFHDFEIGNPDNFDDYILIYEEAQDGDGETPEKYFDGSLTSNPNMTVKYRSKSNRVIFQFASGRLKNFKGFNASYRSWDTYCNKNSLTSDGTVNLAFTYCTQEAKRKNYFKKCWVWCNNKYILSKNFGAVTCKEGSFQPQNNCDLIPYKVTECENTNLKNCSYNPTELANYWRRKEPPLDPKEIEALELDLVPNLPRTVSGARNIGSIFIKVSCTDNLTNTSYCRRGRKTKYAYNCKVFTKIPKLKAVTGTKKMNACFKCRSIDCTSTVYL